MYSVSTVSRGNRSLVATEHARQDTSDGLERDGTWRLLKLRQMGTQRVQMKGILPCLVCWALRAGKRDFCAALAALAGPKYFFLTVHYYS
jgi:hypothetical protein